MRVIWSQSIFQKIDESDRSQSIFLKDRQEQFDQGRSILSQKDQKIEEQKIKKIERSKNEKIKFPTLNWGNDIQCKMYSLNLTPLFIKNINK